MNTSVTTTPIIAVPARANRAKVTFQNTGNTTLYFTRQIGNVPNVPSSTNYDFLLSSTGNEVNEAVYSTKSIAQFNVVAGTGTKGEVSVLDTVYIETT